MTEPTELLPDQTGYNAHYSRSSTGTALGCDSRGEYLREFEKRFVGPFHGGAWVFDGWALKKVLDKIEAHRGSRQKSDFHILDAGCGLGLSSAYLAALGYKVTGIEISDEGAKRARELMDRLSLSNCKVLSANLAQAGLESDSVDLVFGRNTFHHFIKYPDVADEFRRVLKPGAKGLFLDPFGENIFKNLFHDKQKMEQLGDELLTKKWIEEFFANESVSLEPLNWFCLLDKLYIKLFGWKRQNFLRKLSKLHFKLDQAMPKHSRVMLWMAGTVVTTVTF